MLKKLIVLLVVFTSMFSYAQNETLLSGNITNTGYGGPEIKFSTINDDFAVLFGGKGAWVINHTVLIGGGGYGLTTEHLITDYDGINAPETVNLYMGYGGLILGYINNQHKLVHFSSEVLIGAGGATYSVNRNNWDNENDWSNFEDSAFLVIEPSLYLELNVTDFMVVGIGGSYRYTNGVNLSKSDDSDISGFSGNLVFKFGKF